MSLRACLCALGHVWGRMHCPVGGGSAPGPTEEGLRLEMDGTKQRRPNRRFKEYELGEDDGAPTDSKKNA
jgi:hypothetical protein